MRGTFYPRDEDSLRNDGAEPLEQPEAVVVAGGCRGQPSGGAALHRRERNFTPPRVSSRLPSRGGGDCGAGDDAGDDADARSPAHRHSAEVGDGSRQHGYLALSTG